MSYMVCWPSTCYDMEHVWTFDGIGTHEATTLVDHSYVP